LDEEGLKTGSEIGRYKYSASERPWFKSAMAPKQRMGWAPIYSWANSQVEGIVGSGRAVRVDSPEEGLLGVVDVGFTVNALSQQLEKIDISPNGRVFIMDAQGMLVAADQVKDEAVTTTGVLASETTDIEIKRAVVALDGPSSFVDDQEFLHASFVMNEEVYQVDSELLKEDAGPDWRLVTILPESDILAGVDVVQQRLIYSSLIVLFMAGLVAIILARSITGPIISLRKSASGIANGDLDERFSARGGLEFSQLSDALERMTRGLQERLEMRTALAVAMEVQQNLLPQSFPSTSRLDIAGSSIFSDETGGDYFDFPTHSDDIEVAEDGSVTIAIGDVTGHGIGAALIMAAARAALRTCLREKGSLGTLLAEVNDVLFGDVPNGRFMTMLMMRLSADGTSMDWASAGHDPPIIYSPGKDVFTEPSGGGVPLAILADESYDQYELPLDVGDEIIFTATDGVWETANDAKELFGKDRLRGVLRACKDLDSESIIKRVIQALDDFRGSERPADDVTMVVIRKLT
jgi:serine phosphatase RsbU (regulator of sigma subunit)